MKNKIDRPWGSVGVEIKKPFQSVSAVMKAAELDYNVSLRDCFLFDPNNPDKIGDKVAKVKVTVRDDTNQQIGVVGERYVPLQNGESFGWFQEFIHHKIATIEHAGTLSGSNIVFIQAKLSADPIEIIPNDPVQSYITLLNSFDGSTSIFTGFFPVRITCSNMLPKLKTGVFTRTKHTKNALIGLEKLREIMSVHTQEFLEATESYKHLASKPIKGKGLDKYIRTVIGNDNPERELRESRVETIKQLFESGRGASEHTRNYYGAFQAVNEYLNYEVGRSVDSRLRSLWVGNGATVNQKALDVAMKLAK